MHYNNLFQSFETVFHFAWILLLADSEKFMLKKIMVTIVLLR